MRCTVMSPHWRRLEIKVESGICCCRHSLSVKWMIWGHSLLVLVTSIISFQIAMFLYHLPVLRFRRQRAGCVTKSIDKTLCWNLLYGYLTTLASASMSHSQQICSQHFFHYSDPVFRIQRCSGDIAGFCLRISFKAFIIYRQVIHRQSIS